MTLGVYCNILVNLQNQIGKEICFPLVNHTFYQKKKKKKLSILMQLENIFIFSLFFLTKVQ